MLSEPDTPNPRNQLLRGISTEIFLNCVFTADEYS